MYFSRTYRHLFPVGEITEIKNKPSEFIDKECSGCLQNLYKNEQFLYMEKDTDHIYCNSCNLLISKTICLTFH